MNRIQFLGLASMGALLVLSCGDPAVIIDDGPATDSGSGTADSGVPDLARVDPGSAPDIQTPDTFHSDLFRQDLFRPDLFVADHSSPDVLAHDSVTTDPGSPDRSATDTIVVDAPVADVAPTDTIPADMLPGADIVDPCDGGICPPDLARGLVAHYKLDGDPMDSSASLAHGRVHGAAGTSDRFGRSYSAMAFTSSEEDHIEMVNNPALPIGAAARTASVWFRTARDSGNFQAIFNWGGNQDNGDRYGLSINDGKLMFTGQGNSYDIRTDVQVADNQWHHVAITYNGATVRMWLDGGVAAAEGKNLNTQEQVLLISKKTGDNTEWIDGAVDDMRVYDRVLSNEEIALLAANRPQPGDAGPPEDAAQPDASGSDVGGCDGSPCPDLVLGLVAHYPLDGHPMDRSPSQAHGVVHGAWGTSNRFGTAYSAMAFTSAGPDYIEMADNPALPEGTWPRTASAWFRTSRTSGNYQAIFNWGDNSGDRRFGVSVDDGKLMFTAQGNDLEPGTQVADNHWHHVV